MADFKSVAEIELAIQGAKTPADIGDIFRDVFAGGISGFTKRSAIAVDALYTALERLNNKGGTPSAIELRDLENTFIATNQTTYRIREEIAVENPAFKVLIEAATAGIDPKAIKQEAEDAGAAIWDRLASAVEFANKHDERKQEIEKLYTRLDSAEYKDVIRNIAQKIYTALREEDFDVSMSSVQRMIQDDIDGTLNIETYVAEYRPAVRHFLEIKDRFYNDAGDTLKNYLESRKAYQDACESFHSEADKVLDQFRDALMEQSGISKAEAQEWAEKNVYMDKNVERKLTRIGYPKNKLMADIAEFYRLVSGKLGPIEFIGTRSARAFAYSSRCQIAISKYFDKRTLFHECGHIMEFLDTISLTCSAQFRDGRAQGPVRSLKSLTGISGYASSEVAVPDNFIDPYVGKVYNHAGSEVFSMAIENMATTARIINFINKDPEHFKLFLGVCTHKNPELAARIRQFSESTNNRNSEIEDKQKKSEEWLEAIKKACPPYFMEALTSKEGVFGLYMQVRGNSPTSKGWLLQRSPSEPNRSTYIFKGTAASLVKGAYLVCAINKNLIPTEMGDGKSRSIRDYCDDFINCGEVPSWFNKDNPLPKLDLPPDITAKARKGSQKLFLAAVASAIPSDLFQQLQSDEGVDGFYIDSWVTLKHKNISLHHRDPEHNFYYGPKSILPMAYLLIMNKRNLLPEHEESVYMANRQLMYYVVGRDVPDWFDPDTPLPELKI